MKHARLLTIAVALAALQAQPAFAKDYEVRAITKRDGSYAFKPDKLTIKSGDTVTWVNDRDEMHNVMAEKLPEGAEDFESPMFEKKGDKWSYTFKTPGTYVYHCHPHAENNMRGMIVVDRPSETVPVKGGDHHGATSEHQH